MWLRLNGENTIVRLANCMAELRTLGCGGIRITHLVTPTAPQTRSPKSFEGETMHIPSSSFNRQSELQMGGVHVLVVDDYEDNVESMAMLLRLHGHHVQTALSGPAALRSVQRSRPEIVLLDISMPGMDGYEVARQLRLMMDDRIILIALTANGFEEDKKRCYEAGFDQHLTKPADPVDVERLLRTLVGRRQCQAFVKTSTC